MAVLPVFPSLHALAASDAARIGSEAGGLRLAIASGARVPATLVIPGAVFDEVLEKNGLYADRATLLQAARSEMPGWEALAETLAARMATMSWPAHTQSALDEALWALPTGMVVLRASWQAPWPGPGRWNVPPADVIKAANRCWAEAHRPEAIARGLEGGFDPATSHPALLLTPMPRPRMAGRLTTSDVSDPDGASMRLALLDARGEPVADAPVAIARRGRLVARPGLSSRLLSALRQLGLRLERHFGCAVTVSWAVEGGRLWVIDARPQDPPASPGGPARRWSRRLVATRFPEPLTPLAWSALAPARARAIASLEARLGMRLPPPDELVRLVGHHLYHREDRQLLLRLAMQRRPLAVLLRALGALLAPSRPLDRRLVAMMRVFEAVVFPLAESLLQEPMVEEGRPAEAAPGALAERAQQLMERAASALAPALTLEVLAAALHGALEAVAATVGAAPVVEAPAPDAAMLETLEALRTAVQADSRLTAAIASGSAAGAALAWAASSALPAREAFLREFGHLGPLAGWHQPTYSERPSLLDRWLLHHRPLAAPPVPSPDRVLEALTASSPEAARFYDQLLATLHALTERQVAIHNGAGQLVPLARQVLAELGETLTARGAIASPDDVHVLTHDELVELAAEAYPWSRRRLVASRRAGYDRAMSELPVEEVLGDHAVLASTRIPGPEGTLSGRPASPGVAEGRVRLVRTLADVEAFQPGEILVVHTPHAGLAPLLAAAAALVTTGGGLVAPGLGLARAYGLPAASEVPEAMGRLKSGQRIRLDGNTGQITPLTSAPIRLPRRSGSLQR